MRLNLACGVAEPSRRALRGFGKKVSESFERARRGYVPLPSVCEKRNVSCPDGVNLSSYCDGNPLAGASVTEEDAFALIDDTPEHAWTLVLRQRAGPSCVPLHVPHFAYKAVNNKDTLHIKH